MTAFKFTELVNDPLARIESGPLGTNAGEITSLDVTKAVKFGANGYDLCVEGDEIVGFINSVEPFTVNDGYALGAVKRSGRIVAQVGANEAGTMAIDDMVVADAQVATGTAGLPQVKIGTAASQSAVANYEYTERTPNTYLWRVLRIMTGTGVTGDKVLLERI